MSCRPDQAVRQRACCVQTLLAGQQHLRTLLQAHVCLDKPRCTSPPLLQSPVPEPWEDSKACSLLPLPRALGESRGGRPKHPFVAMSSYKDARWPDHRPTLLPQHAHHRRTPRLARGPRRHRTAAALGNQPPVEGKAERGQAPGGTAAAPLLQHQRGGRAEELSVKTGGGGGLPPG